MDELRAIFDDHADFDPAAELEAFCQRVPARWVVYLLADEQDRPIQLLCVKNLRASLRRRLGGDEMIGPSKRVRYSELVRRVRWRRVDSAFEADWIYYEAARRLFPDTYQGMVGFRPAWFVHVDPEATFPRYIRTTSLTARGGTYLGPVEDKHAAARLIAEIEDAFDLCRYHNILVQAPDAAACAYKGMGKCPAPCDGSISMEQYRRMVQWSLETAIDPAGMIQTQTRRMQQAATELRFESAAKVKAHIEQLQQFGKGPFRHARPLSGLAFVAIQPGPRAGTAKLFIVAAGRIEPLACLTTESPQLASLLRTILLRCEMLSQLPIDAPAAERLGIVAQHLFSPKRSAGGVILHLDQADERALARACRNVQKRDTEQAEQEDEGVMKELQAL